MANFRFYTEAHEFEPLTLSLDEQLASRAEDLTMLATKLESAVHHLVYPAMADLVRGMNCYYSNLIEGHNTLPFDIEKALQSDFSTNDKIRDLQKLAIAHIGAEQALEKMVDDGRDPAEPGFLQEAHGIFCAALPESLLILSDGTKLVPGAWRNQQEVHVGRHVPPHSDAIPAFLKRFYEVFGALPKGMRSLVPIAVAHHRFTWIHPFADGNGRVARLMTGAMMRRYGANKHGLWSLSRGLAKSAERYKQYLDSADHPRRGDLDGRGNLSTAALREFVIYVLDTSIDQVRYMSSMFSLDALSKRIETYFDKGRPEIRFEASKILKQALAIGAVSRGDLGNITGINERIARDVAAQLLSEGMLKSDSPRGKLKIAFPAKVLGWYFPNLYPSGSEDQIDAPEIKGKAATPKRAPSRSRAKRA